MKKTLLSLLAVMLMGLGAMAQTNTYNMITSASELSAGDKVLIVGFDDEGEAYVMSYQKTNNRHALEFDDVTTSITTSVASDPSSQTEPFELTVGGASGAWTFFDAVNNGYLNAPGGGNYLRTQADLTANGQWTITFDATGGVVPVSNGGVEQCIMRYNATSTLFSCYKESSSITGLVYIFKASGAPVIDPEPSNYPTGFTATVENGTVDLEWNESTGAQLPRGYLVIGTTGTITVPVDGVVMENNTDPSAGNLVYNVIGDTEVEFHGLAANTTYKFAIFPFTNSSTNINYKTDGTYPTVNATIGDVHTILYANFADGLAPFTAFNIEGEQEWTISAYGGVPFAKMSGYSDGSYIVNEDWLITPNIFANGTYQTINFGFMNAFRYDGNPLKVYMSTTYNGVNNPTEFDWTDVTDRFDWSEGSFAWETTDEDFVVNATSLYFAFVYTNTDAAASTWEVTNVEIVGTGFNAVGELEMSSLNVYPNPATNNIVVDVQKDAEVQILDMTGCVVMNVNAAEGENSINVSDLESGVYFVKMNGSVVKFVKK